MGRKKVLPGSSTATETFELKPFCYYCDREFDTLKTLIQHQRTKHLACAECGLKFDTVTGLRVHMLNAYKKTMKEVPGAVPGRENPDIVVHGMEGIPKFILEKKTKEAQAERAEREKARREKEGLPPEPDPPPEEPRGRPSSPPPTPKEEPITLSIKSIRTKFKDLQVESAPPLAPEAPAPPAPAPAPVVSQPPPPQPLLPQQPSPAPQPASQGLMSGLSPAVQKLLSGKPDIREDAGAEQVVAVPGLPGRTVPRALSGLHPVALQVLAAAGVLPSGGGAPSLPRSAAEKRPAPGSNTSPSGLAGVGVGDLLSAGALPPLAFPTPGFAPLAGCFPPGTLSGAVGAMTAQMPASTLGLEAKRPRLDAPGLALPVPP